jgi:hypothetical protein
MTDDDGWSPYSSNYRDSDSEGDYAGDDEEVVEKQEDNEPGHKVIKAIFRFNLQRCLFLTEVLVLEVEIGALVNGQFIYTFAVALYKLQFIFCLP